MINLGIPETKSIRISYAIATFVIVIITYVKYYTAIDAMRVETANKKTEHRESCYEVINHITFWIKLMFGDIVLIILNLIIWTEHYEDDTRYAGLSLISIVANTLFGSAKYFAWCFSILLCSTIQASLWQEGVFICDMCSLLLSRLRMLL